MTIHQLIMDELADRQVYKHEVYAPFFIASMTMHMFNLYNQKNQIYWESKRLPNLRAHTLFVAPPGFMKCVVGSTKIQMCDGSLKRIDDVKENDGIVSLDMETLKLSDASVKEVYTRIVPQVKEIVTRSGLIVTVTPEHPFLTIDGWMRADTLSIGDRIAIPRSMMEGVEQPSDDEIIVLAGLLAEGGLTSSSPTFSNSNPYIVELFENAFKNRFDGNLYENKPGYYSCIAKSRLNSWLKKLNIDKLKSDDKFIPDYVFRCTKDKIALFLRMYTACDGHYSLLSSGSSISITSKSRMMIEGLRELLLRFELIGAISTVVTNCNTIAYILSITGAKHVRSFVDQIGAVYPIDYSKLIEKSADIRDTIPLEVYDHIPLLKTFKSWNNISNNTTIRTLNRKKKCQLSRSQLMEIADHLESDKLTNLANSDIFWDEVKDIDTINEPTEVYDLCTTHGNFIGNGILLHNSYYMGTMAGDIYSIFAKSGILIGKEQYMCLPAGQQVQMSNGTNKNIEDVDVGDDVLSLEYAKIVPTMVTHTHSMMCDRLLRITLSDGRSIILTPNHPLFTIMGWQESRDLFPDENVACINDNDDVIWLSIDSIEELDGERVYNLSTENHTFIAQNIITHNTEAAFVGTMSNIGGMSIPIEGAAKQYADGLIVIDEFSAITKAMQMQHSNQLDNQLLSALDHGHVIKRLGSGKIEYDTRLTLWAGVQPARFDLTSGMGRRLIYLNFIPTKIDNEYLLETVHNTRNVRPDKQRMEDLWTKIRNFKNDISKIKRLEFDDSVLRAYKELKLFSYEGSYFDRLLIGYHLAQYGPEKTVTITMNDPEIMKIVEREKKWRSEISTGIEYVQLLRIIELAGGSIKQSELIIDAAMYGWNALQVLEMITDMKRYRMLKIEKGVVEIL